jgi:tetratricopeptide (TPR) repeat protein
MGALRIAVGVLIVSTLFFPWLQPATLVAQGTTPDQSIQLYQRMLRRNPADARAYYRLGDAYIQKARESGDVTFFNLAEQTLRKALELHAPFADARRHLAFVLYARHDFAGAAREAATAIQLNPTDGHAHGILGDAYLEVGKYDQARETYETMLRLQADLYAYSRLAGLKSLRGDAKGAIEDLERAIQLGKAQARPRESIAWAQWQLGQEHFLLGHVPQAEASYLEALATYPNYYRALAGLAQVRTAQGRYPDAIALYQQALAIIPMPEYAAALGDIYATLERHEEAHKQYALVEYIGYLNSLNKILYNRELAYFYADHDLKPAEALELARKELEVRQDIYAYDVLAWTLYKNGKAEEALPAIREALKLGTQDARLLFHAGMIYHALGQSDLARQHLSRALALNPHFQLLQAELAQRTLRALKGEQP